MKKFFSIVFFVPAMMLLGVDVTALPPGAYVKIDPDNVFIVEDPNEPTEPEPGIPTAVDDNFGTRWENENVKGNDLNLPQWTAAKSVGDASDGRINLLADGRFSWIPPAAGYCGPVSFVYRLKMNDGTFTNNAIVNFEIVCIEPPPPVDPNEPTDPNEPPANPTSPVAMCAQNPNYSWCNEPAPPILCEAGENGFASCPRMPVTYKPPIEHTHEYSVAGVCDADPPPPENTAILMNGETLQDAWQRMLATGGRENGGTLIVPWDVQPIICDQLRITRDKLPHGHARIMGTIGPNGEMPRFYCRSAINGGNLDNNPGDFITLGSDDDFYPDLLIDGIQVDGYGGVTQGPVGGRLIVRDGYFHHQTFDGFSASGIKVDDLNNPGTDIQFCGNEISHSGAGNAHHGMYIHRSNRDGAEIKLTVVDNLIHSCRWSSCVKSLANENLIVGNSIYKTLETDPLYPTLFSQMLVDIAACTRTTIESNYFDIVRPDPALLSNPGGVAVASRNRMDLNGCDYPRPRGYLKTGDASDPYGGWTAQEDSPFWSEDYWASLNGEKTLPFYVRNNRFYRWGWEAEDGDSTAIQAFGTYPNYALRQFGPACTLPPPQWWYERSRVYPSGNHYSGLYTQAGAYGNRGLGDTSACPEGIAQPDKRDNDLIDTAGAEEVFE